jgi:hypothetical protein
MAHVIKIVEGKLYAYGDNGHGQLGLGHNRPVEAGKEYEVLTNSTNDSSPWIQARMGLTHSVALKENGTFWVWGSNIEGQVAEPSSVKFITSPKKIDIPVSFDIKKTTINAGYYFSTIYATSDRAYGIGTFQNFADESVTVYRKLEPLYINNRNSDKWLTINAGPKTILGRLSGGSYFYADWSGDLFPQEFTTFESLQIGDVFTLVQPNNRDRVLYKKIRTFQKDAGCCRINALCLHATYRDLLSVIPEEELYEVPGSISVSNILEKNRGTFASECTIAKRFTALEQYGTNFYLYSSHSGSTLFSDVNIDPWSLRGLYMITETTNLLDVILYDALFFDEDLTQLFNIKTQVQKLSVKEIFSKNDIFPKYFLNKKKYTLLEGQYYNPDPINQDRSNGFNRSAPVYFFKLNPKTQKPYIWHRKTQPYLYTDTVKDIREVEKDDKVYEKFYKPMPEPDDTIKDNSLSQPGVNGIPCDEQNNILIENHYITDPYLIRFYISGGKSSFDQMIIDPYSKISPQDPNKSSPPCNNARYDIRWPGSCIDSTTQKESFDLGIYGKQLIEYFLDADTDPEETTKFFGFYKIDLEELYLSVKNDPYPIALESFKKFRTIINSKLANQTYLDADGIPVVKTGDETTSLDEWYRSPQFITTYSDNFPFISYNGLWNWLPYKKIACFTDRTDLRYLFMSGNFVPRFKRGATKIEYWIPKKQLLPTDTDIRRYEKVFASLNIVSMDYIKEQTLTKITLDRPFSFNYKIGCVPYEIPPWSCGPVIGPSIYFNNLFNISTAIENMPFRTL